MTNKTQGAEIFLPAPNYEAVNTQIVRMLNPSETVRYTDTVRQLPQDIGQRGVRLYLIEQVRDGVAAVIDLTRRVRHEDF